MRNKLLIAVTIAGLVAGGSPVVLAQDKAAIEAAARQQDAFFRREAARIEAMPEGTPEQRQAKLAAINSLMTQWEAANRRTTGMIGDINRATNADREAAARANYYDNANRRPSFMEKLADTALNIGGQVVGSLLQKWLNGGLNPEERSTLDRMMAERDASTTAGAGNPDNALGKPIYDSNGNIIGWDRDGDNKSDFEDKNGDGKPEEWNGGSFKDGYDYADPGNPVVASSTPTPTDSSPANGGGGGASMGGSMGGGVGGGSGDDEDEGEDKDKKDKDDKDKKDKDKKEGEEGGKDGKGKKGEKDKDGKAIAKGANGQELATTHGRIMILPKPDPLNAGAVKGNVRPGANNAGKPGAAPAAPANGAKKDEWDNWGDEWSDSTDNGDYDEGDWSEDWGDDWGKKPAAGGAPPAPGTKPGARPARPAGQPAPRGARPQDTLLEDLIRVEATIANWRKLEKEKQLREKDPYAFGGNNKPQGNFGGTTTEDPFAAYRTLDGRLDLSKVDVWLVAEDTWSEGKDPRRYRLKVTEDAIDSFDPINEGYMVVRGTILDLPVDPNVLAEIKGEVKELEVAQVVISSKEPPATDGTVDPTAPPGTKNPNSDF